MDLGEFMTQKVDRWHQPVFDLKSMIQIQYTTDLKPADYLRFAAKDLEQDLEHFHINALGNAKRAIDCTVDNLLSGFGLKRPRSFPAKLEVVQSLGLLAPRIVRKVVRVRNLLEHEYYRPSVSEVEDAVDIATLFVEVAARPFRKFMDTYFIADETSSQSLGPEAIKKAVLEDAAPFEGYTFTESIFVEYDEEGHRFFFDLVSGNCCLREITIPIKHPLYPKLIAFTIQHDADHDVWDEKRSAMAFIDLLREVQHEL